MKVGNLRAASQQPLTVGLDESLERARTLMILNDYSQLAVASSPRSIFGAISWESMGQAAMARELRVVRDAMITAEEVRLDDDLLPLLPRIATAGYFLVRARDNTLSGIITAADVADEFNALASPFFLLGEVERRLRLVVAGRFEPTELSKYRDPSDDREIQGVDDLSLGDITYFIERLDAWERLEWGVDRVALVDALHEVRVVRNRLMHFSPDHPTTEEVAQMQHLLGFLKLVTP